MKARFLFIKVVSLKPDAFNPRGRAGVEHLFEPGVEHRPHRVYVLEVALGVMAQAQKTRVQVESTDVLFTINFETGWCFQGRVRKQGLKLKALCVLFTIKL